MILLPIFFSFCFATVTSKCDIKPDRLEKEYTVTGCKGQAIEVDLTVNECSAGQDMISATLSDANKQRVFANFFGICGQTEKVTQCLSAKKKFSQNHLKYTDNNYECHVRKYISGKHAAFDNPVWTELNVEPFEIILDGFFDDDREDQSLTYHEDNECSFDHYYMKKTFFVYAWDRFYYNVLVSKGYKVPIFTGETSKSKKALFCIPRDDTDSDHFQMILNHPSTMDGIQLNFSSLNENRTNKISQITLPKTPKYNWEKGADWTFSALKVFKLTKGASTTDSSDQVSIDIDKEFLAISLNHEKLETVKNATNENMILLTQFCDSVMDFDGAMKAQSHSMYKTFTGTVSVIISGRSIPKLDYGDWFLAVYTKESLPSQENSYNASIKAIPYNRSVGIMFGTPLGTGLAILILYHFAFEAQREPSKCRSICKQGCCIDTSCLRSTIRHIWKAAARRFNNYLAFSVVFTVVFWVPGFQFVWTNYFVSQSTGNKDICFYNDKCYFPSYWFPADFPINAVSSNMPYLVHGVLVILYLAYLEFNCHRKNHDQFYDYSISQAVGFSLFSIGLFSLTYHICPTRAVFQLDTNGMYLCATLIIVSVFQGWSKSPEEDRHKEFMCVHGLCDCDKKEVIENV